MPEEVTNQSTTESTATESTASDDLFDEGTETTTSAEPEAKESTTETSESQPETNAETTEPFLDIKYNGAIEHLTRDQAIELAQKGRNYDKLNEKYQSEMNSESRRKFENMAKANGMSLDEYANRLGEFQRQTSIRKIANQIKEQYPNADEEFVNAYAESRYENQVNDEQRAEAQKAVQAQQNVEKTAKEWVDAFVQEYPDVDLEHLPAEVKTDIDVNGKSLLDAYRAYDLKITKQALAAERQNKANRASATGNLSESAGDAGGDDFLSGLLG